MTVSTTASVKQYTGNASTTIFSFPYKVFNSTDFITTILNSSTLVVTTQVNGGSGTYDYSVAVAADKNSANITFNNAPLAVHKITIERKMSLVQSTDYTPNDPFPAETHEQALDERTLMVQQVQNSYELNTFRFDKNVTDAGIVAINKIVAERASKLLAFDSAGDLQADQEIGTLRGNWAASTAYSIRDLVKDSSNSNFYICIVAHTSSGSTPISGNTDVAKWTLIIDAAAASTSATAAATSATASATSATASATSATASATSATTSTAQAVIATAKAVLTASDAVDTAADVVSCNAVLDIFDDAFLGSKSSGPTLDNDGDALADGAMYFNTTSNVMFVYDSGNTTWLNMAPTAADQININAVAGQILFSEDLGSITAAISTGSGNDITTVADAIASIIALAPSAVIADMALLGDSAVIADMALLGDSAIITDMALLGLSAVITDMALLAVPAVITDMDLLGATGVIDDLETCSNNIAGVNSFAERYRVDSSNPTGSLDEGDLFFNTSDNTLKYYNGSAWASITAGIASIEDDTSPTLGGQLDADGENIINCGTISGANLQMDFGGL